MESKGTHFVLIHGMGGGAWSWFKIKALLEYCSGHKATCLDLRGCGVDPTQVKAIHTFDEYNQPLDDFMAALPEDHKVVLVGHSAGGLSVTTLLHKFPTKIQLAIYVAATMLKFNFRTPDDRTIGSPDFSEDDKKRSPDSVDIYTSVEDMTLSTMLVRPAPMNALLASLVPTESEESEKIPRVYIKTRRDSMLKPEQQEAMILRWAPAEVYEIDSDHNPLFTSPLLLSAFLLKAVASFT